MDFVTGLPISKGYDSIFVVVDMLTKVAHLFPVCKKNSAHKDISHVFMKGAFLYHSLPWKIISDRDSKFSSSFRKTIFEARGTQLSFSIAYHPQTNGQIEHINQIIEDML